MRKFNLLLSKYIIYDQSVSSSLGEFFLNEEIINADKFDLSVWFPSVNRSLAMCRFFTVSQIKNNLKCQVCEVSRLSLDVEAAKFGAGP